MPNSDPIVRRQQQQARQFRKLAEAAIAFGCPGHSRDNIDMENLRERPNGAHAPRSHYWDPWLADWRDKQSHEPYVSREHQQRVRAAAHAAAVERYRLQHHNRARCNGDILKPGFDLSRVTPHGGGKLGDATCHYCGALLYPSDAVIIPRSGGCKRGKYCCAEGQVVLPEVEEHATVDARHTQGVRLGDRYGRGQRHRLGGRHVESGVHSSVQLSALDV